MIVLGFVKRHVKVSNCRSTLHRISANQRPRELRCCAINWIPASSRGTSGRKFISAGAFSLRERLYLEVGRCSKAIRHVWQRVFRISNFRVGEFILFLFGLSRRRTTKVRQRNIFHFLWWMFSYLNIHLKFYYFHTFYFVTLHVYNVQILWFNINLILILIILNSISVQAHSNHIIYIEIRFNF